MGILFPVLDFFLLFLLFGNTFLRKNFDWRESFILASLAWGGLAVLAAEVLSLFGWITPAGLISFWVLSGAVVLWAIQRFCTKLDFPAVKFFSLDRWDKGLVFGILFIIVIIALIAFKAPPNTYDSMTYHMSRVAHWVQNKTLTPYPTHILRQNVYTPFAEIGILHLQVLSGSDRFANFVQWFSMIGSIIGASLIAQHLGATRRGQILAAVLTATIPMGILQGSSTQTDYVTAFWLVCLISCGLSFLSQKQWFYVAFIGMSLGLAALTKGTSYFFSTPFILAICLGGYKIFRSAIFKGIALIIAATLLINAGFYMRNFQLQKSLLSQKESEEISNQEMNPALLTSNLIKNFSLHWGTPSETVNALIEKTIYGFHGLIGVGTSDGRISWDVDSEFHIGEMSRHEDNAGNLLHFILNTACIVIFMARRKAAGPFHLPGWYLGALLTGFVLFNLYMKWAPWHSRYHLPLFVLFAPWAAAVLDHLKNKKTLVVIGLIFLLTSMPWVWGNKTRSFFKKRNIFNTSRLEQYFYNKHGAFYSYYEAVNHIHSTGCRDIGLILSPDTWEYPYWPLFRQYATPFRMEHVQVKNISKELPYPLGSFTPCAILDNIGAATTVAIDGKTYVRIRQFAYTNILIEDTDGTLAQRSLLYHFSEFLEDSKKFYVFLAQNPLSTLPPDKQGQALELLNTQLNNAAQLDLDRLNDIHPFLGFHIEDKFVQGVTLIRDGLLEQDTEKLRLGQQSLAVWNIWFEKNISAIQKNFEKIEAGVKENNEN